MRALFVAILPAIDYDLTTSCVSSMCWELSRNLLLVDNSQDQKIAEWARPRAEIGWINVPEAAEPANRGVPRSWNKGVDLMRSLDREYLVIVSQSVLFGPSGGRDFLDELNERQPEWIMHDSCGWKLIALNRELFSRVGVFDEIFSPAYFEESDMLYRMGLAGVPSPRENGGELDQVTTDARSRGDALALKSGVVDLDYGAQAEKYRRKWLGDQGKEATKHPYGDPSLDYTHTGPVRGRVDR